jgi:hypothetical protein
MAPHTAASSASRGYVSDTYARDSLLPLFRQRCCCRQVVPQGRHLKGLGCIIARHRRVNTHNIARYRTTSHDVDDVNTRNEHGGAAQTTHPLLTTGSCRFCQHSLRRPLCRPGHHRSSGRDVDGNENDDNDDNKGQTSTSARARTCAGRTDDDLRMNLRWSDHRRRSMSAVLKCSTRLRPAAPSTLPPSSSSSSSTLAPSPPPADDAACGSSGISGSTSFTNSCSSFRWAAVSARKHVSQR